MHHVQSTTLRGLASEEKSGKATNRFPIAMAMSLCNAMDKRFWTWFLAFQGSISVADRLLTFPAFKPHREFLALPEDRLQPNQLFVAAHLGLVEVAEEALKPAVPRSPMFGRQAISTALQPQPQLTDCLTEIEDTRFGHRLLHIAVRKGWGKQELNRSTSRPYSKLVRLLLEKNAKVDAIDDDGRTPLRYMIEEAHSSEDIMDRLEESNECLKYDQPLPPAESEDVEILHLLLEKMHVEGNVHEGEPCMGEVKGFGLKNLFFDDSRDDFDGSDDGDGSGGEESEVKSSSW